MQSPITPKASLKSTIRSPINPISPIIHSQGPALTIIDSHDNILTRDVLGSESDLQKKKFPALPRLQRRPGKNSREEVPIDPDRTNQVALTNQNNDRSVVQQVSSDEGKDKNPQETRSTEWSVVAGAGAPIEVSSTLVFDEKQGGETITQQPQPQPHQQPQPSQPQPPSELPAQNVMVSSQPHQPLQRPQAPSIIDQLANCCCCLAFCPPPEQPNPDSNRRPNNSCKDVICECMMCFRNCAMILDNL